MAPMQILIQIKAIFVGFFALVFVLLPGCLIAFPFPLERRLKMVSPVWKYFGLIILRYACHAKIRISEDHRSEAFNVIPAKGLLIANHQSFMDIPLQATKHQAPPIMKKEVLNIPILGWMAWISGALPVSRSKTASRRQVFEKAKKRITKQGIGLQVYPEGTRSKTAHPKAYSEIKRTLLIFAYNEKIPVIPVSIYGTRGILNSKGMITPGRSVGIIVHKEIDPKDFSAVDAFTEACWNQVIQGYDQMQSQLGPLNEN